MGGRKKGLLWLARGLQKELNVEEEHEGDKGVQSCQKEKVLKSPFSSNIRSEEEPGKPCFTSLQVRNQAVTLLVASGASPKEENNSGKI